MEAGEITLVFTTAEMQQITDEFERTKNPGGHRSNPVHKGDYIFRVDMNSEGPHAVFGRIGLPRIIIQKKVK